MKSLKYTFLCLLLAATTLSAWAAQDYELYINGVLYKAPSILEKGLPYFPVDVLSEATGVSVVSFSSTSVKLAGSPVDFAPVVRKGRPFLPAEAFAMATGSGVEVDQTRGMVKYTKNPNQRATASRRRAPNGQGGTYPGASPSAMPGAAAAVAPYVNGAVGPNGGASVYTNAATIPGQAGVDYVNARAGYPVNGPGSANPGVTPYDPGPEVPVAAPPSARAGNSRSTEGLQDVVLDAMKTAQEVTYAQRWMRHKMYWVNQLDPQNSPYLKVNLPPGAAAPMYTPHPWATP